MTISPADWLALGKHLALPGARVFAVDLAPQASFPRTPVLVLHGFPTSSWDFAEAAAEVARRGRRVLLFDDVGFGFSDKPAGASGSVFDHADAAAAVVRAAGVNAVCLWAHDMGTSVATELLARGERGLLPFTVAGIVLMNGGVFVEMSRPALGQRLLMSRAGPWLARLNRRRLFVGQMRRLFGRPPADGVLDAMWDLVAREDGHLRMPETIRFMHDRVRFRARWVGALTRTTVPVLVAWGARDPVTTLAIGQRLAREVPGAALVSWDELGHYPHVEDPGRVANDVCAFLERIDRNSPSRDPG